MLMHRKVALLPNIIIHWTLYFMSSVTLKIAHSLVFSTDFVAV